jgi:hypothetical protein
VSQHHQTNAIHPIFPPPLAMQNHLIKARDLRLKAPASSTTSQQRSNQLAPPQLQLHNNQLISQAAINLLLLNDQMNNLTN